MAFAWATFSVPPAVVVGPPYVFAAASVTTPVPPVTVANVNEMPPNWYVDQSGGSLYLIFSRGTYIIFR